MLRRVEKADDRSELVVPADKLTGGNGHMAILSQVAESFNSSTFGLRRPGKA